MVSKETLSHGMEDVLFLEGKPMHLDRMYSSNLKERFLIDSLNLKERFLTFLGCFIFSISHLCRVVYSSISHLLRLDLFLIFLEWFAMHHGLGY